MNDNNIYIKAHEVQIGDNVWEHNLVYSIHLDKGNECFIFNKDSITSWTAKRTDDVMVSNASDNDKRINR